ncbi:MULTISPECIES: ABC transporter ATP-binding protein [unclassified Streptomyces]|uniref:ABC transporter ATP-binding protein n=1 Tax=unclassified Streptomyces TaxID=2593676 RepID=UPI0008239E48|nr:ABC transporter ATP-binding protein [Streptomyces sp. AmelKG-D3]MYT97752.1 ATP-binding cassette domain-containing protein [Streptomyces sp. SID8350]SCK17022.1 ATP-binding cassette, subfamily B [Streptomyces sp. AmelKG-D3]
MRPKPRPRLRPPAPSGARRLARRHPGALLALFLCSTGGALAALALPAALGHTVDRLVDGGAVPWAGLLLCAVLTLAETGFDAGAAVLTTSTGARLTAHLRTRTTARVLAAEPRRALAVPTGDLTARLTARTADAATAPVTAAGAVAGVLLPLGAIVGLFVIDPWTAAAFLLGAPLLVALLHTFTRRTADAGADYQRAQSVIAHRLTEALDGADTIRAARTGAREYRRILEPLTTLAAHGRRTWTVYGRAAGQSALLLPLLMLLVLAVGGLRLQAGAIGVGDLVAASRYAALAVGVGSLTGALGALARSRAAARTLDPLLTLDPLPHEGLGPPHGGPGHLELRDVGVVQDGKRQDVQGGKQDGKQEDEQGGEALPDGEPDRKPLLTGVHLTVPGGTSLAVVGRSGSGKSVFAAVVGRLLDPDTGTVLLDGIPLTAMEPARLRPEIAYAFARPALPGTTVEETIAFGPWTAGPAAVREGARAARADGFVGLLPYGYATPLTDAPLSGGERQRLGLARAFAHPGRLLILDDALSGLDTVTEHHVRRALDERAGRCTRVIVAHRLSSAARADQVLWLEDGRVRATGPHEELWADPEYRAVFRTETGEAEEMAEADEGSGAEGALPRARTEVEAR